MKVWGLYFCQDCQAGESCGKREDYLMTLYSTETLAKNALKKWINLHKGCYVDEMEATCYYDVCLCDNPKAEPCTYQEYLKACDWSGLQKVYIKELDVLEEQQ